MKKSLLSPLFSVFLIIFLLSVSVFVMPVKATTYEWIQNGGFEACGGNVVPNSGFEEGSSGWSPASNPLQFSTVEKHSGAKSLYLNGAGEGAIHYLAYNLSTNVVSEFSAWFKGSHVNGWWLRVYYNDSSFDDVHAVGSGAWQKVTLDLDADKYIEYILVGEWAGSGYGDYYCDDVFLGVVDEGQTDFDADTLPWWSSQDWFYQGISVGTYHSGLCSAYLGYEDQTQQIIQDIGFLDSDFVSSISLYAKCTNNSADDKTVRFLVVYSDRSYTFKDLTVANDDGWKLLNFSGFVLPNKVIVQVQINIPTGAEDDYVNFDDVSLLASVASGVDVFTWDLTPSPLTKSNLTFSAYMRTDYVMLCYVFNDTGYAVEDGTFSVVSSSGSQSGSVSDGSFSFAITARASTGDFEENFVISVVVPSKSFTVIIVAHWVYVGGEIIPPTGYDYAPIMSVMVIFLFLFVPALLLGAKMGMIGFIAGLTLGALCCYLGGIMPLWGVFLMGLVDIMLILSGRGTRSTE